ncbi:hypothetical protein, partial [Salmonella sp. s54412]|uniref:hypothetical protein n=1 Tax=Salmonella sp. s54412 TaxID=3160128 RepID=UPI003754516F
MMGTFDKNVYPSNSKGAKIPFSRSTPPVEHENQKFRVVERSGGNTDGNQTRTVVKETRTQTPQGVKTIKTTTTWTTNE